MTPTSKPSEPVRIANGQGFWGDSILGPVRLLREGPLDYLTLDYLAEVTLSIMQKLRSRRPDAGYATDFVHLVDRVFPDIQAKGVKIVCNAGGVNPHACKDALAAVIAKLGGRNAKGERFKIAIVEGDDILGQLDALLASGEEFRNMDTGAPLADVRDSVSSANVYLGAFPIAEALAQGADIVLTGRGTDPGLVLGPLIHEFGWGASDYDRLAAGTIAGHIVECGAQCTGGNHTDWRSIPDLAMVGYPIVEAQADGSFVVTKHANTGGRVDLDAVRHQLVYEMGDPRRYLTPDCIADFTSFRLEEVGTDRVAVTGVKGAEPTPTYKVSISHSDGWKSTGQLTVSGPDALAKAKLCAEIVWKRLAYDGFEYGPEERMEEYLGANVCHAGIRSAETGEPSEIVLRMGVRGPDRAKVDRFGTELVPLVTSGPPGVTGFAGGRPKATEIVGFWPALVTKSKIDTRVTVFEV
ncbi:MAG: acyclic terpene utilization AtuA family protein [Planctomycetota bacterium]